MIVLMGLAGSGKSTQGNRLAEALNGVWLSAGQVLRDTPDEKVHEIQQRGELVPDTITIPLMAEAIRKVQAEGKMAILDGYPRTVEQAEWVANNIADQIALVIKIEVPKAELLKRMELRGRADDLDRASIEERWRIIEQNIYAVCEILAAKGVKICEVDGDADQNEVAVRIRQVILDLAADVDQGTVENLAKMSK